MKKRWNWLGLAVVALALAALGVAIKRAKPWGTLPSEGGRAEGGAAASAAAGTGELRSLEALRRRALAADAGAIALAQAQGQGQAVARVGWGAGEGQLGKDRPLEGNPEAPMSLAAGSGGRTWVLDQVNNRLLRLGGEGTVETSVPLTVQGAQDLAVGGDGTVAVMDRLLDKQVALYGPDGKLRGALPLEGKHLEEGGTASAVLIDGDDVYVEREHGDLVKVGDTSGKADSERPEVPGRPTRDGKGFLTAMISSGPEGRVAVTAIDRPSLALRFTRELRLGVEVYALNLLDTDRAGVIYLGVMVLGRSDKGEPAPSVLLLCLDPRDGLPLGKAELPPNEGPEETLRELVVLDQGGVLYLHRTDEGAALTRWDCR